MNQISRRESLRLLAWAPWAGAFTWTAAEVQQAHQHAAAVRSQGSTSSYSPRFFTPHEYETVRVLADIVLPRDERSGSASDAGVPEFMDFLMMDQPERQTAMRGGLAWLDVEALKRFDRTFLECEPSQRLDIVEEIAWPEVARPELSHGVAFFNSFRDLTATGFWTSKMGIEDLQYLGNTFLSDWNGCPPEALERLGVRYED